MTVNTVEKHDDCGGYWLKKQLPDNIDDYRCTRCGIWKSKT